MKDEKRTATGQANGSLPNRILGSLRDALNAASRLYDPAPELPPNE